MESIKAGDAIKILALEQTFERILNHPFTISGIDKR
jgi:hypothetical protein